MKDEGVEEAFSVIITDWAPKKDMIMLYFFKVDYKLMPFESYGLVLSSFPPALASPATP